MNENSNINYDKYPLLSKIDSPAQLRELPLEQLPAVCAELRAFLIEHLAVNPGHFASSMGAVDLTVALHYVFDTPDDRLVWDVGHQAYSHKILTGRRDAFVNNRKFGGLSGFPNPFESQYDAFIAGHASNSISAAIGMATSAHLQGIERNVVAVIGDASISGGLAFEGLNNASINKTNMLIVLNDNDKAIDDVVGAFSTYMNRLTTSKRYNDLRYRTFQAFVKHGIMGDKARGSLMRFFNSVKSLVSKQQNIFEGLNIRYFGPFDGHDVVNLVQALRGIKDMKGPKLIHLCTRKGNGYAPAEEDPTVWHAPGKFNPETGELIKSASDGCQKYQDVFGKTLVELAEKNPKIVAITAAMPTGCSTTFMQERFPQRTFDVGIAEEHAVTFSAGMAKDGLLPYCCIYSTFLQRGYDEIIHDVALQKLPVVFCIDRAGLVGEDGATHHGAFDMAYMRCIPGMTIASPIDEHWLRHLLYTAQTGINGPIAIRYPRGKGSNPDWKCPMQKVEIGKGRQLSEGTKLAVLSIGPVGQDIQKVIAELSQSGHENEVAHYDMVFVKPLDEGILRHVGTTYRNVITVEDGTVEGGLGTAVCDWMSTHDYDVKVSKMGLPDQFVPQGTVAELYQQCAFDKVSIKETMLKILNQQES